MASKYGDMLEASLRMSATLGVKQNDPAEVAKAVRVICGSDACQGPKDALLLMEALGIEPIRSTK